MNTRNWWLPCGTFAIAVLLTLLSGPVSLALSLRDNQSCTFENSRTVDSDIEPNKPFSDPERGIFKRIDEIEPLGYKITINKRDPLPPVPEDRGGTAFAFITRKANAKVTNLQSIRTGINQDVDFTFRMIGRTSGFSLMSSLVVLRSSPSSCVDQKSDFFFFILPVTASRSGDSIRLETVHPGECFAAEFEESLILVDTGGLGLVTAGSNAILRGLTVEAKKAECFFEF